MTTLHIVGIVIALVSIISVSFCSARAGKKKKGATSWLVSGAILGTLIGGSSTVGTAQLAYQYGMSAWWFTLGGGIACLILALVYVKPLQLSGNKTLNAFITKEYGKNSGLLATIFSTVGMFINIISQLIASTAIIAVALPDMQLSVAVLITTVFMVLYVIFGGVKGSGMVGLVKVTLLYFAMLAAGWIVLRQTNGLFGFINMVDAIDNPDNVNFYSLFARGFGMDFGACVSLVLGVITTQSYAQVIFMAADTKSAVRGTLLSAILGPIVGIGGILVGLYMRAVHPGILSKTALTLFVTEYMHPLVGGIVLGALFIAVIGSGAGLVLGIATSLKNDVLPRVPAGVQKIFPEKYAEKFLIIVIATMACVLTVGPIGDTILNFAFMSMGLRGATLFVPLCGALWFPGKVCKKAALVAVIAGPATVLLTNFISGFPIEPLFAGVLASFLIMLGGYFIGQKEIRGE